MRNDHKPSLEKFNEEPTERKKSQTVPDRYTVLILNTLNEGEPIKTKKGHTGKIKKIVEIAARIGQGTTNESFRKGLKKCEKEGYIIGFSTKKERLKIFQPRSREFFNYSGPCQQLTEKGIQMVASIQALGHDSLDEIISSHITKQNNLSEEQINDFLEICKGIPNPFKILSELETLKIE